MGYSLPDVLRRAESEQGGRNGADVGWSGNGRRVSGGEARGEDERPFAGRLVSVMQRGRLHRQSENYGAADTPRSAMIRRALIGLGRRRPHEPPHDRFPVLTSLGRLLLTRLLRFLE